MSDEQVALTFAREMCEVDEDRVLVLLTRMQLKRMLDEIDATLRGIPELPTAMRELQARISAMPVQGRG